MLTDQAEDYLNEEGVSLEDTVEFIFSNVALGTTSKTGIFNDTPIKARQVFREAARILADAIDDGAAAVTFTASGDSRSAIYRMFTKKASKLFPGYVGIEQSNQRGDSSEFAIVLEDLHETILDGGGYYKQRHRRHEVYNQEGREDAKPNKELYAWMEKYDNDKFFESVVKELLGDDDEEQEDEEETDEEK